MQDQFERTRLLYGDAAMKKFAASRVAVFGIGGVGGHAMEALARTGIGALDLIDSDEVDVTNLNRQLLATVQTIGRPKVEVAAERIADIAPSCKVRPCRMFFLPETKDAFDFTQYDYVVDAIDTVSGKLAIIECAKRAGVPVISAMGAGNKVHPAALEVADIYETSVCPLARVMRQECRKRGIDSLKVVYSKEKALRPIEEAGSAVGTACTADAGADAAPDASPDAGPAEARLSDAGPAKERRPARRSTPGSTAFTPAVAGLIIASEVINDLAAGLPESPEQRR